MAKTSRLSWIGSIQVMKTAFASGLAWYIAGWTGTAHPYFGPLAAILCLQVTVRESVWRGYQRILGIVCGVVLADIVGRYIGIHGWSIGLLVLVGTGLATWFRIGGQAVPQVGVSAMMVLAVGGGHYTYGWDRILDTAIGAVIAIVINMFVIPPDYTKQALMSLQTATNHLADRFTAMGEWLKSGAKSVDGHSVQEEIHHYLNNLHRVQDDTHRAIEAVYYSPLLHNRKRRLHVAEEDLNRLRQGYAHAAGMLRTFLEWTSDMSISDEDQQYWALELLYMAQVIRRWGDHHARMITHPSSANSVSATDSDAVSRSRSSKPSDCKTVCWSGDADMGDEIKRRDADVFAKAIQNDAHQLLDDFRDLL